jgi:hypothetical protein
MPRNIRDEHRSHQHRSGSLKSRLIIVLVKDIITLRKIKDHAARMGENRWQEIAWNYKAIGKRVVCRAVMQLNTEENFSAFVCHESLNSLLHLYLNNVTSNSTSRHEDSFSFYCHMKQIKMYLVAYIIG